MIDESGKRIKEKTEVAVSKARQHYLLLNPLKGSY